MKIDGHVIPVLLFVNFYVYANTWAVLFSGPRPRFFNDSWMCFFYDYLGRRWSGCFSGGGSYRRRRLRTSGDPE